MILAQRLLLGAHWRGDVSRDVLGDTRQHRPIQSQPAMLNGWSDLSVSRLCGNSFTNKCSSPIFGNVYTLCGIWLSILLELDGDVIKPVPDGVLLLAGTARASQPHSVNAPITHE